MWPGMYTGGLIRRKVWRACFIPTQLIYLVIWIALLSLKVCLFVGLVIRLWWNSTPSTYKKKGKRKVEGVPQSQAAAPSKLEGEEETDKTKPA